MFAKVKPEGGDFSKAKALCAASGEMVWLCEGVPELREYNIFTACDGEDCDDYPEGVAMIEGIPNFDQAEGENRMFWQPGYCEEGGLIPASWLENGYGHHLVRAVNAARAARFEHGEQP